MSARSMRRGNWSVQELERLRLLLPRRGVAGTAVLLRRSRDSVFRKALAILRVPPRRGAWTASDDERLREAWGAVEPRLLGPMLGRTPAEVVHRAAELRAQVHSGPWQRGEIAVLKELYGTRHDADLEVSLLRPRDDIAEMATRLCLAKDKRFAAHALEVAVARTERLRANGDPRRPMPRWRDDEVDLLRRIYADADNLAVARRLGRTVTSVANKANLLGLKKSDRLLAEIGRSNVAVRYGRGGGDAAACGEHG
jgi:hypothetical protein